MWRARGPHESDELLGRGLLRQLHGVLGDLPPVRSGQRSGEAPLFHMVVETRLESCAQGTDVLGANTDSGFGRGVVRALRRFVSSAPRALGNSFELLTRHVAKHLVIHPRA